MSLQVNDKQILKSYNKIWEKVERLMFTEFDSEPTYGDDDKYIKTKIKSYKDSITTNFYKKNTCKCLSIIILDSVLYVYRNITLKYF